MAFNFGGLSAAFDAAQKQTELERQRRDQEQDRAYLSEQRTRQRDTWAREDQLRNDLSNIQTTKQVDVANPNAPVVDNDDTGVYDFNNPGAAQAPGQSAAALPAQKTVKLTEDEQLRQAAEALRRAGNFDGYRNAIKQADEIGWKRSSDKFAQLQASAAGMSPDQLARAAADIYNGDPFGGQITDIKVDRDTGAVTMSMSNRDSGASVTKTFAKADDMLNALHGYFSPQTFAALQAKRAEAAIKAAEKANEPFTLRPGEERHTPGQPTVRNEAGYTFDGNGNTVLAPRAGSKGAGGKADDPLDAVGQQLKFVIEQSVAKGALPATDVARANVLSRQLVANAAADRRNLDPSVAVEVAIKAITQPASVEPWFDPKRGRLVTAVEHQGNRFTVEDMGAPTQARFDTKTSARVAMGYIQSLPPEQRLKMVAAAFNGEARRDLDEQIASNARAALSTPEGMDMLRNELKRDPTPADVNEAIERAKKITVPALELISRFSTTKDGDPDAIRGYLKEAGYAMDGGKVVRAAAGLKDAANRAAAAPAALPARPAGSAPMTLAERQERIAQEKRRLQEVDRADTERAKLESERLLAAGNRVELARFQASPLFSKLDKPTQLAIWQKVNGN